MDGKKSHQAKSRSDSIPLPVMWTILKCRQRWKAVLCWFLFRVWRVVWFCTWTGSMWGTVKTRLRRRSLIWHHISGKVSINWQLRLSNGHREAGVRTRISSGFPVFTGMCFCIPDRDIMWRTLRSGQNWQKRMIKRMLWFLSGGDLTQSMRSFYRTDRRLPRGSVRLGRTTRDGCLWKWNTPGSGVRKSHICMSCCCMYRTDRERCGKWFHRRWVSVQWKSATVWFS